LLIGQEHPSLVQKPVSQIEHLIVLPGNFVIIVGHDYHENNGMGWVIVDERGVTGTSIIYLRM
jgi:hypothetical protein